jgi:Rod binding domain-containing protein
MTTDSLTNTGLNALSTAMAGKVGTLAAQAASGKGQGQNLEAARDKAEDFEAMFLSQMLEPMFDTIDTDGPFSGGSAEKTWRSLMVQEYGKMVAKNGGIGVADSVMKVMLANQEA